MNSICHGLNKWKFVSLYSVQRVSSSTISELKIPDQITETKEYPGKNQQIPLLLLPHTAQRAYNVHLQTVSLPKVFDKYKWLTKTVSTPGLPSFYMNKNLENESEYQSLFSDSLLQAVGFQKSPRSRNRRYFSWERVTYNFLSNVLQICIVQMANKTHLKPGSSFLYHNPLLETNWFRNYNFFHAEFKPTFVLKTCSNLSTIETPAELLPEEVDQLPGPYDNYSLNTYFKSIKHLKNHPNMMNSQFNQVKHTHSTFIVAKDLQNDEQFFAVGTMALFSQLISQAQDQGILHGTDLEKPLVSQCIVTNGYQIAFLVYQLNTMNLLNDKGLWNRVWYSHLLNLYEMRDSGNDSRLIYETAEREQNRKTFCNSEACRYIINFIARND